jgi:hypothetical protein
VPARHRRQWRRPGLGAEIITMLAHFADTLTHLSYGQSISVAACVATFVVLVFGWWNLGT